MSKYSGNRETRGMSYENKLSRPQYGIEKMFITMKSINSIAKAALSRIFRDGKATEEKFGEKNTRVIKTRVNFSEKPFENLSIGMTDHIDLKDMHTSMEKSVKYIFWSIELGIVGVTITGDDNDPESGTVFDFLIAALQERFENWYFSNAFDKNKYSCIPTHFIIQTSTLVGDYFEMNHEEWDEVCEVYSLTEIQKDEIKKKFKEAVSGSERFI